MYILASKSPRRRDILDLMGLKYICIPSEYDESSLKYPGNIKYLPKYLSYNKCLEVFKTHQDDIVIGADTIVIINKKVLGKPKDKDDASQMLHMLSNKTHMVVSGVCIKSINKTINFIDVAYVTFKKLNEEDIEAYLNTDEPYDKAGSYAIQGAGNKFIKKIRGDYYTIMGLPYKKLIRKLKLFHTKEE